ncbi:MAG: hypothetical protein K2H26_07000 [Ruminococcus sp.]|nr:hypothetical protein [Ruminococcus sp.]MDE6500518.1 hypothetical protein [Ruminococcus sp.]
MIKGVNRKIIEVNRTDSIYFEKAVFYLRPEVRELPMEVSRAEAEKYISQIIPELRRRKRFSVKMIIPVAVIATAVAVFMIHIL